MPVAVNSAELGSLALLKVPYVFTQDGLLDSGGFIRAAKERGVSLSLSGLQRLHEVGLLIPLYRVDNAVDRRLTVEATAPVLGHNPTGWVFAAAREGRLRDPAIEGFRACQSYQRPPGIDGLERWWNGYVYSPWQLLDLLPILNEYKWIKGSAQPHAAEVRAAERRRAVSALSVLATRYLPGVLSRLRIPPGVDEAGLRRFRATIGVRDLVDTVGVDPVWLAKQADWLLGMAHSDDPVVGWLPLIRHASYSAWSKLRGAPLAAMWQRVAAEVLLRAYEDLAAAGAAEPLVDLNGVGAWVPQHDRLTARYDYAPSIDRALTDMGLSPYPRVVLLIEGETERRHIPELLDELGLVRPGDVRVQPTVGSKTGTPHLIARFNIAPKVGQRLPASHGWLLEAPLTALMIAMDPENDYRTAEKRDEIRRNLQQAIRDEVAFQDATITQDLLDALVNVRVWGDVSYELANFTDDELVPAIITLASQQHHSEAAAGGAWEAKLRAELASVRAAQQDIKVALGRVGVRDDKRALADLLWPVLLAKCETELANNCVTTPVLQLLVDARALVARLAGIRALEPPKQEA